MRERFLHIDSSSTDCHKKSIINSHQGFSGSVVPFGYNLSLVFV